MKRQVITLAFASLLACGPTLEPARVLLPEANPMPSTDPLWSAQPHRDRPRALCIASQLGRGFVMLAGTEEQPGTEIAVVDLEAGRLLRKLEVGASPYACALDPSERYLVVTLRYTDRARVLDVETEEVVAELAVPFYTESVQWSPDGSRLWFASRWTDSVFFEDVETEPRFAFRAPPRAHAPVPPYGTPVGDNPGPMVLSKDGQRLFVGLVAGAAITVVDAQTGALIDADGSEATTSVGAPRGISRLELRSPVGGLATWGHFLVVSDMGRGVGSEPSHGRDVDGDGRPGDGTANVIFQDLQNELAVIDTRSLIEVDRHTSDTICCLDYRDVDPERPTRGLDLPSPDTWAPEVLEHLPPRSKWTVAGALPEALIVVDDVLWVAFAGSNEVQSFSISEAGGLDARDHAGALYATGYNPKAIASYRDRIVVVNRLGESLTVLRPGQKTGEEIVVGDVSAGPFPTTDAELGEGINEMTAAFTIDGDQTCVHCHRDNGAIARPVVMPLQIDRLHGARAVMAQRGLFDTRPWFFESAMDETNFFPVLNEFSRKENFCCEQLDPTIWSKYPSFETCTATASSMTAGCEHVLSCDQNPPPECATRPYALGAPLRRSEFIKQGGRALFQRDTTFGDVLNQRGPPGAASRPLPLDFDGFSRALGLFMLRTPRLLPNPNRARATASADRGRRIFEDPRVGCALCHPLPLSTTTGPPTSFSPSGMPIRFPPVVSPTRAPDGTDASQVNQGFIATFPQTVQSAGGLHIGATPLRGLWDRPHTHLLHDGRARSLREVLATPGHPALEPGEVGRNERDGVLDTHGGTSHLGRYEIEDLMNFLETL